MNKVINIREYRPHRSGEAICFGCKHQWVAVIAVEDDHNELECPECKMFKGRWYGGYALSEGELKFECNCGNDYFIISSFGAFCPNCGVTHSWDDLQFEE